MNIGFSDPQTSGLFIKNRDSGMRRSLEKQKPQPTNSSVTEDRRLHVKKGESIMKSNRPINANPRPVRQAELKSEQKVNKEMKLQPKRSNAAPIQQRQLGNQQNVS